jgi:thymidine phosphorylase
MNEHTRPSAAEERITSRVRNAPQKIIEAAHEHLPGLIEGRTPKQLDLLTGTTLQQALDSGAAAERFARMVVALGGPADLIDAPVRHLARAAVIVPVPSPVTGVVQRVDCRGLGLAVVALGGGRTRAEDAIDVSVGLTALAEIGQRVAAGEPLGYVHARDDASAAHAVDAVRRSYVLGETGEAPPTLYQQIG